MKMIFEGDSKEKDKESERQTIYRVKVGSVGTTTDNQSDDENKYLGNQDLSKFNQEFMKNIDLKADAGQLTLTALENNKSSTRRISTLSKRTGIDSNKPIEK